ncbi:PRC-barrel domain-containing protein [Bacillus sp. T33-2]|uniref:PRC-barrel domain-containing protein n=1 Tax=Bacillus sp. T33-2 TaxID=2054168 RepID=UPI000C770884|nr:PRC-barrel domain-containing protein [Bacillus sp. T33-2]PLR93761.1 photosystem reaction center subunit H [Bacillus sp. T33-2]
MRTFSLLKGLPVFEVKNGTQLGEVCDISISGDGRVEGLLLRKGMLLKKSFIIKLENVLSFGWDGVMVRDAGAMELLKSPPEYTIEHGNSLAGKMAISNEGEQLGLFADVYFKEEVGTIVGYELSDGFFSDISEGKRIVESAAPPAFGKDAIIVFVKNDR